MIGFMLWLLAAFLLGVTLVVLLGLPVTFWTVAVLYVVSVVVVVLMLSRRRHDSKFVERLAAGGSVSWRP
jgi:Flp pilus assembly protein TadB